MVTLSKAQAKALVEIMEKEDLTGVCFNSMSMKEKKNFMVRAFSVKNGVNYRYKIDMYGKVRKESQFVDSSVTTPKKT
jgi:hypothetical protein